MPDAGIGRGMAVMVVAVPTALVEKQLEASIAIEIVIFDQLLLRKAVDHHEQHELRGRLAARCTRVLGKGGRRQGYSGKQSECAKSAVAQHHDFLQGLILFGFLSSVVDAERLSIN